jgi:hypothetical protein
MIVPRAVNFGAKYLTGRVTSVPPYDNILLQSKNYKNHFEN